MGQNRFAAILMASVLTVGVGGLAPAADAASAGQLLLSQGDSSKNNVIAISQRRRGTAFYLPIAPSRLAFEYPYYYSRGHYPKHIRPGYVYYGYRLSTSLRAPFGTGYASPIGTKGKKAPVSRR